MYIKVLNNLIIVSELFASRLHSKLTASWNPRSVPSWQPEIVRKCCSFNRGSRKVLQNEDRVAKILKIALTQPAAPLAPSPVSFVSPAACRRFAVPAPSHLHSEVRRNRAPVVRGGFQSHGAAAADGEALS